MNIKIEKVDINNTEVLTFLALENLKMFLELRPNIKSIYESGAREILISSFIEEFKKDTLDKVNMIYAAFMDEKIVGAIQINNDGYLSSLFVLEEYRNQKIGSLLLERLIKECNDFDVIRVDANIRAISLYERFNFRKMDTIKDASIPMELERSQYGK